jgi:hypothetical protein
MRSPNVVFTQMLMQGGVNSRTYQHKHCLLAAFVDASKPVLFRDLASVDL